MDPYEKEIVLEILYQIRTYDLSPSIADWEDCRDMLIYDLGYDDMDLPRIEHLYYKAVSVVHNTSMY